MEVQSPDKPCLLNAFSANQLVAFPARVHFIPITVAEACALLAGGFVSAVGHPDTAALFSRLLGLPVPVQRDDVPLPPGARSVLGQYRGPRLPEGVAVLPPNASIEWLMVRVSVEQDV